MAAGRFVECDGGLSVPEHLVDFPRADVRAEFIVLGAVEGGKVQLAAGVTADATGRVKAGDLVNYVAQQVGGKGGGKPDLAMAGGTDAAALPRAIKRIHTDLDKGVEKQKVTPETAALAKIPEGTRIKVLLSK